MCTVLLRFAPDRPWPLLVAAVRDEFLQRPWDPPAAYWPDAPSVVGGRDRTAGGTWLAVRRHEPAVAALLNGKRLPESGPRPSRGGLPLAVLTEPSFELPDARGYDGFHLLRATPTAVIVWSWDGVSATRHDLAPGDHIIVNLGVDTTEDPLVPHFAPLLAALPDPPLTGASTVEAWGPWVDLLRGDGLAPDDDRALLVRKEFDGKVYGSGSATLVAISPHHTRYDFTPTPATPQWTPIITASPANAEAPVTVTLATPAPTATTTA